MDSTDEYCRLPAISRSLPFQGGEGGVSQSTALRRRSGEVKRRLPGQDGDGSHRNVSSGWGWVTSERQLQARPNVLASTKSTGGRATRIYLANDGLQIIVLLGGGSKKRQQKDIDDALALWEDYKQRKAHTKKGA